MYRIFSYWLGNGVDGFGVDFAHFVPNAAWRFLLSRVKTRDPGSLVIAEAYEDLSGLLSAGFDAVYHDAAYDTAKRVFVGRAPVDALDAVLRSLGDVERGRYVHYLENHDERRIASPIVLGEDPDETGLGSAAAGKRVAPLLLLYGAGPVLVLNGQEVGEPAHGAAGFGGDDGRTTIFDYGVMPALARWVNGHLYDGGASSAEERALRAWYADLLALCQASEVRGDRYWGLRYALEAPDGAASSAMAFARFATGGGSLLLVLATLGPAPARVRVRIPDALAAAAGLRGGVEVTRVLGASGAVEEPVERSSPQALASRGLDVAIPIESAQVYRVQSSP